MQRVVIRFGSGGVLTVDEFDGSTPLFGRRTESPPDGGRDDLGSLSDLAVFIEDDGSVTPAPRPADKERKRKGRKTA